MTDSDMRKTTVNIDELVKENGFCVVPKEEEPFSLDEAWANLFGIFRGIILNGIFFCQTS